MPRACPRCKSTDVVNMPSSPASKYARRPLKARCRRCGARFSAVERTVPGRLSRSAVLKIPQRRRFGIRTHMGLLKNRDPKTLDQTEKKMAEHELAIAADIQENLMPKKIPRLPNLEITAYYKPCQDVGGDYYDFIRVDDDHLGFLVADVSGKGIPGALVMVNTRAYVRSGAAGCPSPAEVCRRINRQLYLDIPRGMFVTMFYGVLNIKTSVLTCVSAGHNPMVLWRCGTNTCHIVNPNGLALGIDKGPVFERTIKEQQVQLHPGDRFVMYTDGLVEAMSPGNEQYGSQRLYRKVKETASMESSEFISLLVKSVEDHVQGADPHDDLTIVTARSIFDGETPMPKVS